MWKFQTRGVEKIHIPGLPAREFAHRAARKLLPDIEIPYAMKHLNALIENSKQAIRYWWLLLLAGIVLLLTGILVFIFPGRSYLGMSLLFGWVILLAGILEVVISTANRHFITGRGWMLAGGIIQIVLGVILIFNVGLIDFETTLLAKIQNPAKIVDLSRGIQLIEGTCAHGKSKGRSDKGMDRPEHDHGHDHGVDPHVWTSPKALKIMAENAFTAIREQYPDSVRYRDNFEHLIQKIDELDARTRQKIELSGVKYFIVYHPALTYYARDYGIRQVAIETDGKEPSARQLAGIIRNARKDKVRKIFYQNQFPKSVVEVIAQDMEAEYIEIDPLDEQVLENIDRITDLITQP